MFRFGRLALIAFLSAALLPAGASAATYYVDCSRGSNGNGSATNPWNALATVSNRPFAPGDTVLFQRGTTCNGALLFRRAGTAASRITIGATGAGAAPIINGAGNAAAVRLTNPSYVTVQDLEIANSARYGLFATSSTTATVNGLQLRNLVVHDVTGSAMDGKATGLVLVMPGVSGSRFNDVLIEGVTAYDTSLWAGILVHGEYLTGDRQWARHAQELARRSTNIMILDCTVHDTQGDGIATYMASHVVMAGNVVYRSGMQPIQTIATPNAIWSWASNDVLVHGNEAYDNHSPGADGGAFDIDYYSADTTVQYNYAHDNQAYCVAVFGAERTSTVNSIIRYNVCANNGRMGSGDGAEEIYFATWNSGRIDGARVYNNTVYPTARGAVGTPSWAPKPSFGTLPLLFENNLVVSAVADVLGSGMANVPFQRDYNLYRYTAGAIVGDEPHSVYGLDPLVSGFGYHDIGRPVTEWTLLPGSPAIDRGTVIAGAPTTDFYGNDVPRGLAPDIGAHEAQ